MKEVTPDIHLNNDSTTSSPALNERFFRNFSGTFLNLEFRGQVKLLKRAGKFSNIVPAQQPGEKLSRLFLVRNP